VATSLSSKVGALQKVLGAAADPHAHGKAVNGNWIHNIISF
jgi:hypothetical protein